MKQNSSSGIGLTGLLFVVFLVLKLTGNIDWSWWWVTSPIWIPVALVFGLFLIVLLSLILLLTFGFNIDSIKNKLKNKLKR
jgi:hypothetical protein